MADKPKKKEKPDKKEEESPKKESKESKLSKSESKPEKKKDPASEESQKKRKPRAPKKKAKKPDEAELAAIDQDGGGGKTIQIEILPFPVRLARDDLGEESDIYADDNNDQITEASTQQLSVLWLIKDAALKGLGYDWPTPDQQRADTDALMARISTRGAITRVAIAPEYNDSPIAYYVLMPPKEQGVLLQPALRSVAPEAMDESLETPQWDIEFPPRGGPLSYNSAYLSHLYVHPTFHRLGIGSQLMDDLIEQCNTSMSASQIEANTDPDNQEAQAFFQKHDFHMMTSKNDHIRWSKHLPLRQSYIGGSPTTATAATPGTSTGVESLVS